MAKKRVCLGGSAMSEKEKQAIKESIVRLSGIIKTGETGSQIIRSIRLK